MRIGRQMKIGSYHAIRSALPASVGFGRTLLASLAAAVVLGVGEVMVRFNQSSDAVVPGQLALAIFANVAILGTVVLGLTAACWPICVLHARLRRYSLILGSGHSGSVVLAICVATLVAMTGVLALVNNGVQVTAVAVGTFVAVFLVWRRRAASYRTRPSACLGAGVVLAWLFSLTVTAATASRTFTHVRAWVGATSGTPTPVSEAAPNLLLVVLDTLRADRVGVYGHGNLTPNLDALASSSIVYTRALSTAPWTLPTHASLFTGMYPEDHGVNWGHYELDDRWPVLGELLSRRGYDSFAVSNNWLLSEANGFDRGFDAFIETSLDPMLSGWRLALQCRSATWVASALGLSQDAGRDAGGSWTNWLLKRRLAFQKERGRPFFAFVNYFEPHDPYRPVPRIAGERLTSAQRDAYARLPQSDRNLSAHACGVPDVFTAEQIALMSALYDAEVVYQDEILGDLIDELNRSGRLDDTWIVVTSDHGELFGEGPGVYHTAGSNFRLLHVPLIVRPPGGVPARRVDALVQPVDVFLTLAEAAGAVVPPSVVRAYALPMDDHESSRRRVSIAQSHGASIAGLAMAQRASFQTDLSHWLTWVDSVYDGRHLLEVDTGGPRALYDVQDDPAMRVNRLATSGDVAASLVGELRSWQASAQQGEHRWRWAER